MFEGSSVRCSPHQGALWLVNEVRMSKCSITLNEQLRQSARELQKTQRELIVGSGAVLEASLAMRNLGEACLCLHL